MKRVWVCGAVLLALCAWPRPVQPQEANDAAALEARTPEQVVTHHLAVFRAHDLEGVLSDYADDAIFIAPKSTAQGKTALRKMFASFFANANANAAPVFDATVTAEGDVGYEHWISNPGQPGSMAGTDAFVVRHGRIVFHTAVDIHPVAASQ
ncbi:MAG TPA: nuclear transport factor 2 family protein [Candidatus Acidoferrales bacterium]|nr:nuclear transport factor 2 family protein [Candidatus Acidoferrales bacterium]